MNRVSRRNVITTATGSLLTVAAAATAARADYSIPQPRRSGHGGTDPGPRNLMRDRQNPDMLVPPSTDRGTLPNLASPLRRPYATGDRRLDPAGDGA
jgi:oxalate decarboxylase